MQVKRVVQIWYLQRRIARHQVVRPVRPQQHVGAANVGRLAAKAQQHVAMTNTWAIHQM